MNYYQVNTNSSNYVKEFEAAQNKHYNKLAFINKFEENYPKKNLGLRRILTFFGLMILIPIHLVLWLPIAMTLWLPYCLFQISNWLIKGKTKKFSMAQPGYYTYTFKGVFFWYHKALQLHIYRIIMKWTKGDTEKELAKIKRLAEEAYEQYLKKYDEEKREARRIAPYMKELDEKYPGVTV